MADITLYDLPGCPFCARVRSKLDELGLEYDVIEVPRSHADRTQVEAVSGQTGVPVITDEATGVDGMAESADIVEYLEETYA
ncbi:glutathione S-transferase N-terminal domain-containing protein [Natrarchaeobaculum sulfurireducens]|uniref:Glutaredoxin n=1 Tax=Natrarchaeobaculum sulfurireducens TaxID=2044521 RepID=A0A346PSK9_9EURY|nr:glutathione S-transferase N-terminal domain-containing protein [Natrarchaeobaculum sulfurireducens]AXR77554.1 Glutaredoxin [Natrarchaeobaculum sulfurireducens]AXR82504.1 Glutathione S-transferase N-terminal domain [Natrarchaeobaculum sulfurireducens]